MEPGDSILHSQKLSSNTCLELNISKFLASALISVRSILIMSSHLHLDLPRGLFPVGFVVKILKAFLPSSIQAKCPAHLNLFHLRILFLYIHSLHVSLKARDAVSQPYSTTGNIIILILKLLERSQEDKNICSE